MSAKVRRDGGARILSASVIGLSALGLVGGVAYVQIKQGEPLASLASFLENPSPPRDLAQTEAARASAEKRLAEAMAIQITSFPTNGPVGEAAMPRMTMIDKQVERQVPERQVTERPVVERAAPEKVVEKPVVENALPEKALQAPGETVVARFEPAAPVQPQTFQKPTMSAAEQQAMMDRVAGLLKQGDVGAARAILNRLVREHNGQAAYLLGQSYDPEALKQSRIVGVRPDPELARTLYQQALNSGVTEAQAALQSLPPRN